MLKKLLMTLGLVAGLNGAVSASQLPDFTQIVEKEGRAVVNISTTSTVREDSAGMNEDVFEIFRRFGFPVPPQQGRGPSREHQERSLGSGFIIDGSGYILTNAHVIAKADEITVKLTDKRSFKAKVVGSDARTDVALLKIESTGLPKVTLGDSNKLRQGEWVVAIGQPFGLDNSVTAGIVSAKGRSLPDENFVPFIQTDVAINPGSSGGPLFNLAGEVVGINSQIYSRSGGYMGLSFSIPIDVAMKVVDDLKKNGKVTRGRLGVSIQDLNDELAKGFGLQKASGVLFTSVEKDGPADKAGLKAGDILTKFNGQVVETASELPRLVSAIKPGTKIVAQIWRDKAIREITVVIGELDQADKDKLSAQREYRGNGSADSAVNFGLEVQELNPQQLKRLAISFGLLVKNSTGPSAAAGIEVGDVIVGLAGQDLTSFAQLKKVLQSLKPNDSIPLRIVRNGTPGFVVMKAPAK